MADPRIAAQIHAPLAGCERILNIGAGAGSYEPEGAGVVALEPSWVMLQQRRPGSAPAVQGHAEALPFADNSFDAAMGALTLHHWHDKAAGLREALRVASGKLVLFTWVGYVNHFWMFDYFPEIETIDEEIFPSIPWMEQATGARISAERIMIPADCSDGFMCGNWRNPEHYLDPGARGAISTFPRLERVEERIAQLRADLDSGAWYERNAEILERDSMDYGYRVVVLEKA